MTLIAAVRAGDGIAMAADSQETIGDYRRAVQKLVPRNDGNLHTVIGGSGDADLVEAFVARFYDGLSKVNISSLTEFVAFTERELADFYQVDVALSQAEDKEIRLLIGASLESTGEYDVWRCRNIRLQRIGAYELIGWDDAVYHGVILRLVSPAMSLQQSILVAAYTLVIAEQTSNYVKGPMSVVVVMPKDIWRERQQYVKETTERLIAYERDIHELFLACADTRVSPKGLQSKIDEFTEKVQALHKGHLDAVARDPNNTIFNTPFPKLPPNTKVAFSFEHGLTPEYDADMSELEWLRQQLAEERNTLSPKENAQDTPSKPEGDQ